MQRLLRVAPRWDQLIEMPNGVHHFVLPVQDLTFFYSSTFGCSRGMREFLRDNAYSLARQFPTVHFTVISREGRAPAMVASYSSGYRRFVPVPNKASNFIAQHALLLLNGTGGPPERFHQRVHSTTPAVRPIWSPFHDRLNCPIYDLE